MTRRRGRIRALSGSFFGRAGTTRALRGRRESGPMRASERAGTSLVEVLVAMSLVLLLVVGAAGAGDVVAAGQAKGRRPRRAHARRRRPVRSAEVAALRRRGPRGRFLRGDRPRRAGALSRRRGAGRSPTTATD
ncbi:MAG: hypothetical protein MZU84_09095 [Sphingobacterium sp.]|nr:hypothetical protein [Sphingobacterium sp.]